MGEALPNVILENTCTCLSFNPNHELLASGDIEGHVSLHTYLRTPSWSITRKFSKSLHAESCRAVNFSTDGTTLFTAATDLSLCSVDVGTGKLKDRVDNAHECAVYCMHVIDDYLMATGDDDGTIKMWDYRQRRKCMSIKECDDFISDLATKPEDRKILLASSGEGTLTALDVRGKKLVLQSELFDSELLSVAVVKGGSKVIVGDGEGVMYYFNWNEWGNMCDRFPVHSSSIDSIVPISDDIVCTGCLDGKIRSVSILPNQCLSVIGSHEGLPIVDMDRCKDVQLLASCSHDEVIKLWDVSNVADKLAEAEASEDSSRKKRGKKRKSKSDVDHSSSKSKNKDFFSGLASS